MSRRKHQCTFLTSNPHYYILVLKRGWCTIITPLHRILEHYPIWKRYLLFKSRTRSRHRMTSKYMEQWCWHHIFFLNMIWYVWYLLCFHIYMCFTCTRVLHCCKGTLVSCVVTNLHILVVIMNYKSYKSKIQYKFDHFFLHFHFHSLYIYYSWELYIS